MKIVIGRKRDREREKEREEREREKEREREREKGGIGIKICREIGVTKETKYRKHREEYFKEELT